MKKNNNIGKQTNTTRAWRVPVCFPVYYFLLRFFFSFSSPPSCSIFNS